MTQSREHRDLDAINDTIDSLLEHARRGDETYSEQLLDYIKGFEHIILRGAGNFGSAFGAALQQKGVPLGQLEFWDMRATELKEVAGVNVALPFSTAYEPDKTLVINCIPNGSLSGSVGQVNFTEKGYLHYLSGMALFEAIMCSMSVKTGFDAKVCLDTTFCNWCSCKRLSSILMKSTDTTVAEEKSLVYPLATFVVNQKCTLSCTHCGQYINHYDKSEQINFTFERVKKDVDKVFDAVDAIGYVSIIGGEPFVHPQLSQIVEHVLTKSNFGVIGITTNGVCQINDDLLIQLKGNQRTRIIFSDYTKALNKKQKQLFEQNLTKIAQSGISYTVGQPIWSTPASLKKMHFTTESKVAMKAGCNSRITCKTIQNGVFYPCSTTAGMGSHKLAQFQSDWVVLDDACSNEELRTQLIALDEAPFYESCDHCGEGGKALTLAGEQGVGESYIHIDELKLKVRNR